MEPGPPCHSSTAFPPLANAYQLLRHRPPANIHLDPASGILTGTAPDQHASFKLTLKARNRHGKDQRVSIDDCWMTRPGSPDPALNLPPRDSNNAIRPNSRFPDMNALTTYIHAKGLKAGIYTSPGPLTC